METSRQIVISCALGEVLTPEADGRRAVRGVTWDSRQVSADGLFVAIAGEKVDGNDYAVPAITAGASCVLVTSRPSDQTLAIAGEFDCLVVLVESPQEALRRLADAYRTLLSARVVGVTGSTGKTTTKDLIAAVLSVDLTCTATRGNYNNELGVPYTVLSATPATQALVVEMGMRGAGQLTSLSSFVRPQVGVITNVGVAHMELLGSQEAIALAKGELVSALPADGTAVLNGDDPFTPFILERCPRAEGLHVLTYGTGESCDVRATDVVLDGDARPAFDIIFPDGSVHRVSLHLTGVHNVHNALAAAAVGYVLGMTPARIVEGLLLARPGAMRQEVTVTSRGVTVVNDAYNANPDSMRAALATLEGMEVQGRRIAVLGDMGELGEEEVGYHREVGVFAARSHLDLLVCVGPLSAEMARAAVDAGMPPDAVFSADGVADALEYLAPRLRAHDAVLVKASRSMGLERIVKGLVD